MTNNITINGNYQQTYSDVYTPEVMEALSALSHFNKDIKEAMALRIKRREERQQQNKRITFPDPETFIPRTSIKVKDARDVNLKAL